MTTYIDVSKKISMNKEGVIKLSEYVEHDFWYTINDIPDSYKSFLFEMSPGEHYIKDDVDRTIKSLRILKVIDDDKNTKYEAFVMIFFLGVVVAEIVYDIPDSWIKLNN